MKLINNNDLLKYDIFTLKMYLMIIYCRDMTTEAEFIEHLKCNKLGKYLIDHDLEVAEYQVEEAIEYLESKA